MSVIGTYCNGLMLWNSVIVPVMRLICALFGFRDNFCWVFPQLESFLFEFIVYIVVSIVCSTFINLLSYTVFVLSDLSGSMTLVRASLVWNYPRHINLS